MFKNKLSKNNEEEIWRKKSREKNQGGQWESRSFKSLSLKSFESLKLQKESGKGVLTELMRKNLRKKFDISGN